MDEKELLRQLQKQRAGALETAIAQYGAYVLAVIRNRSRGVLTPEDHEEIASDVFLALWRGAKNITRGQLRPWLGAVARKQTAEAMRKKNVYLPLEDDALITLDRLWEQMVEKERCEALAQALAALPEEDREIFYRFYDLSQTTALIEGHIASYDETTDVDITQPTYTEEEQAMIDEGSMQVPDIADLSDTGVSAETDDFTFTLESMLVSRNSLDAILRIDAKNDDAAAELAAIPETNDAVSITLKDGTSFELASVENDYADSAYGTYGSMSSSGTGMPEADQVKHTWLFSQLIDLADLASITVDGVTYPVG